MGGSHQGLGCAPRLHVQRVGPLAPDQVSISSIHVVGNSGRKHGPPKLARPEHGCELSVACAGCFTPLGVPGARRVKGERPGWDPSLPLLNGAPEGRFQSSTKKISGAEKMYSWRRKNFSWRRKNFPQRRKNNFCRRNFRSQAQKKIPKSWKSLDLQTS